MGTIRLAHDPRTLISDGPVLQIQIGVTLDEMDFASVSGEPVSRPLKIRALIDTGASLTVINPEVANRCRLRQTGFQLLSAAGSEGRYPSFSASISFPGSSLRGFDPVPVVACKLPRQSIACLIGRDLMARWSLEYDGRTGEVTVRD